MSKTLIIPCVAVMRVRSFGTIYMTQNEHHTKIIKQIILILSKYFLKKKKVLVTYSVLEIRFISIAISEIQS